MAFRLNSPTRVSYYLHTRNNRLFLAKWIDNTNEDSNKPSALEFGTIHSDINLDLLTIIAQCAADTVLDLGHDYTLKTQQFHDKINLLLKENAELRLSLEQSKNILLGIYNSIFWKLTQPLRKLNAILKIKK